MSGLFITEEMQIAKNEIRRDILRVIEISNQLYERLKSDILSCENVHGEDCITYTIDRKIGKTYNLMRLAIEFDCPLVVDSKWVRTIERESKKIFGKKIMVFTINNVQDRLIGCRGDILLKDERVDGIKLRNKLDRTGLHYINIVGIN